MIQKICTKCNIEKYICEFRKDKSKNDGYYSSCKECKLKYMRENKILVNLSAKRLRDLKKEINLEEFYFKNREKLPSRDKEYYIKNREKKLSRRKEYEIKNKEKIKSRDKEYRINNRERRNEYERNRKLNDPIYKLKKNVRTRLNKYLKSAGITKSNRTFDIVGCSPPELKEYLERQFADGMSWEKMGKKIHIDHIIPLSSAKTEEEIYKLAHYSNLQPLWAKDNLIKSNKKPPYY